MSYLLDNKQEIPTIVLPRACLGIERYATMCTVVPSTGTVASPPPAPPQLRVARRRVARNSTEWRGTKSSAARMARRSAGLARRTAVVRARRGVVRSCVAWRGRGAYCRLGNIALTWQLRVQHCLYYYMAFPAYMFSLLCISCLSLKATFITQ